MSSKGSYFVSKFKGSLCRSFGHSMRKSISTGGIGKINDIWWITMLFRGNVPGPGTYRLPSDFGYYESAKIPHNKIVESVDEVKL